MGVATLRPQRIQTIVGIGLLPAELAAWWIFWKLEVGIVPTE